MVVLPLVVRGKKEYILYIYLRSTLLIYIRHCSLSTSLIAFFRPTLPPCSSYQPSHNANQINHTTTTPPPPTMRTLTFLPLLLAPLIHAAPPAAPRISRLVFSGTGCPSSSTSVSSTSATLGDTAGVTFTQLRGSTTDNCAVHVQSSGASAGWQVAVRGVTYEGDVVLKGDSGLDTYTQVFWSDKAGDTVSVPLLIYSVNWFWELKTDLEKCEC